METKLTLSFILHHSSFLQADCFQESTQRRTEEWFEEASLVWAGKGKGTEVRQCLQILAFQFL